MRVQKEHLDGIVQLHRLPDPEERRAVFRQSMAALASIVAAHSRPVPLEGLSQDALHESVRVALADRLLDDLGFLSGPAGAAALYELAAALPPSDAKREIGRRVLHRLYRGDAATFVALATQLALGSKRALGGAPIRARVALALELPIGAGVQADTLALALISRREHSREWLTTPSTGALPARRLAARLLERAARDAARRASEGDDSGVRVFRTDAVRTAWDRLLADRESLVWRHVASARGLLSQVMPDLADEVQRHLDPGLTPTEWRRAAASLAASLAVDPEGARHRIRTLLDGDIPGEDPGVAGAMMLGLPRAAEARPAEAEDLLEDLVRVGGLDAAEALVDLRRERLGEELGMWAAQLARAQLREALTRTSSWDDGRAALMEALADELAPEPPAPSLRDLLSSALMDFVEGDAMRAFRAAQKVLEQAQARMKAIETSSDGDERGRRAEFRALRELDVAILETDQLAGLLTLGARGDDTGEVLRPLGDLFDRLTNWMVLRESDPITHEGAVPHFTLRLRRLRTMIHLVDADGYHLDDRHDTVRRRRLLAAGALLERVRADKKTPLRRALCAATARTCDALVREEIAEISDVLIAAAMHVRSPHDLSTLAEASMVPEVEATVRAYAELEEAVRLAPQSGVGVRDCLAALFRLANELPPALSPRVEALRRALLAFGHGLDTVATARDLHSLGQDGIASLERAVSQLARLVRGARGRLAEGGDDEELASGAAIRLLDFGVERAIRGSRDGLDGGIATAAETLRLELPEVLSELAILMLDRVTRLPIEAPPETMPSFIPLLVRKVEPLPPWMPPGRILGGFYVLRALGSGAGGSVFVARRTEEQDDDAERFALKVPDYDGSAARALTEEEFLKLFRGEAGALLALPPHAHLARFVTFDAGARPKPILVMELVEGPSLERVIEVGDLTTPSALDLLDGVAQGLAAMHDVGVAHLDVKPSNVILRLRAESGRREPVLVDFGLAGRHLRPGCATAEYGAPEVWGNGRAVASPLPADIYALGCVAFELLTGRTLFQGPNEIALITAHLTHDGKPPGVRALLSDPASARLGELLVRMLRTDPLARASIEEVRYAFGAVRADLEARPWPLAPAASSPQPHA